MVKGVWDFKAWMEPFLGALKYHSKYLCFRFTMNDTEEAELHYKMFSDHPWEPEIGVVILSVRILTVMDDINLGVVSAVLWCPQIK